MNNQYIQGIKIDWQRIDNHLYLNNIASIKQMKQLMIEHEITFFVGENGTGKSTLLEALAVAYGFNKEGGTLNYRFQTFEEESALSQAITIIKGYRKPKNSYFFRAESFFNVASKAEEYRDGDPKEVFYERYGGKSLHEQSHGESFLAYFQGFTQSGLFIMDEPEAALSPQRQLALFIEIARKAKQGSQFIIATHSPILLSIPGAKIIEFNKEGLQEITYEESECFKIMDMFINNRESIIERLLEDEDI